jgi:hypothetical protein
VIYLEDFMKVLEQYPEENEKYKEIREKYRLYKRNDQVLNKCVRCSSYLHDIQNCP